MRHLAIIPLFLALFSCNGVPGSSSTLQSDSDHAACLVNTASSVEATSYRLWFYQFADRSALSYVTGVTADGFEATYDKTKQIEAGKDVHVTYQGYLIGQVAENPGTKFSIGIKINSTDRTPVEMIPYGPNSHVQKATFNVPVGSNTLAIWFEAKLPSGEVLYDSNFGQNYSIEVVSAATNTACFDGDWRETVTQTIRSHETIAVAYDRNRILRHLEGSSYNGMPAYGLTGFVRFTDEINNDFGTVEFPLEGRAYNSSGNTRQAFKPVVLVPGGATQAVFWFKGSGRGRPHFDSNHGEDYVFKVR